MKRLGHCLKGVRAFTLLEILIVVIIVGIMATVAVPQFTKMIERAREAEAMGNLSAMRTAQKVYYLENNGVYAITLGDLLVELEASASWDFSVNTDGSGQSIATRTGGGTAYNGKTIKLNIDGSIDATSTWPLL